MQLIAIRPEPPGSGNTVARFDIAITNQVRLYNLKLVVARDGSYRVYSPSAYGSNVATFAPQFAAELARAAAAAALGEKTTNANRAA